MTVINPAPAAAALEPSRRPAEGDGELLRRLAGCLAHNVNNALTGVIGYLELGLRDLSPRSPVAGHLQAGLSCAFQAAAAVKRIITFVSRPEGLPVQEPVHLADLVEQLVKRLRNEAPALTIQSLCSDSGWVLASAPALQSALQQLIDNALEAMPAGGTLQFRLEQSDDWCRLSVADTGEGVPPEFQPYLFLPFHTTKPSGHLGLGLVQCRELLRLLGGRLELATVVGQGTTVTLALPALSPPDRLREEGSEPLPASATEAFTSGCCVI